MKTFFSFVTINANFTSTTKLAYAVKNSMQKISNKTVALVGVIRQVTNCI